MRGLVDDLEGQRVAVGVDAGRAEQAATSPTGPSNWYGPAKQDGAAFAVETVIEIVETADWPPSPSEAR